MYISRKPTTRSAIRGTSFINRNELDCPDYTIVYVTDEYRDQRYSFTLGQVRPYLQIEKMEMYDSDYAVFSFLDLLDSLFISNENEKVYTQEDLASKWNIHQCRIKEVKNLGILNVDKKDGKKELFKASTVMNCELSPQFTTWHTNVTKLESK